MGSDTLNGGAGNDTLIATVDNVRDTLDGGGNTDTADYAAYTAALTVNLGGAAPIVVGGSGSINPNSDVVVGIENFTGGSGNDTLTGSGVANVLIGGAGNDTINGEAGNDTINGGAGADILIGGNGADTIDSGAANDNLQDVFRFSATAEFGDTVNNFDANGADGVDDRVSSAVRSILHMTTATITTISCSLPGTAGGHGECYRGTGECQYRGAAPDRRRR